MKNRKTLLLLPLLAIATIVSALAVGTQASYALATSRTYTLDADFDEGNLVNLNHDAPNNDQLQLNATTSPFPFVNIAASQRGTVVRIDVNTGAILGEYSTNPDAGAAAFPSPSRTTVDQLGNVWVANRGEFGDSPPGGAAKGSIARMGLVIGGTRTDSSGTPAAGGQYLKPPFQYSTCIDRHGATIAAAPDGLIKTSDGLGNILTWPNAGGVDTHGGVTTAEDECIINYTRVTGTGTRTVAIDANNDVWVGGISNAEHEKVDGVTGNPVPGTQFNLGCGGYGGLLDGNGVLWSSANLRFDTGTMTGVCLGFDAVGFTYGLGIDPNTGNIWETDNSFPVRVRELNPADGTTLNSYTLPGFGFAQGIAVDGNSHVWAAEGFGDEVAHFAPDPNVPGTHLFVGTVPGFDGTTGVAIDAKGKVWASEINSSTTRGAARIDPNAGPLGCGGTGCGAGYTVGAIDLTVGLDAVGLDFAGPYNYSDMTGFVAIGATAPQGTWTVTFDSEEPGTEWGTISWNTENAQNCPATAEGREPLGTSITARARSADTEIGLAVALFIPVPNGVDIDPADGRFIQVELKLEPNDDDESPILCDVTIETAIQPILKGRMTGGGSVFTEDNVRVTHGFTLHCNVVESPNSLEVNWEGNRFHLESLDSVLCTDDPNIDPNPPAADFDTYEGKGSGRYNGVSGATALWTFTDASQPGRNDTAAIRIFDAGGNLVLEVANNLNSGNHQAHSGGPPNASPSPPATATPPSTPPPGITETPTDTPAATPTATPTVTPTPAPGKKPEMALTVKGADCDDPFRPTKCNVPTGSPFILSVDVLNAPADGYIVLQTFIDYGPLLTYKPAQSANDEIVWPDAVISVRAELGPGLVNHGALAGLIPPLPPSFFEGNVVELVMNCTPFPSSNDLELLPEGDPVAETNGTSFRDPDNVVIIPKLGPLTINCDDALIALADTDGDGCADLKELGPDEQSGGQRDPHNPWDFYDTNGDGVIDLTNDIFGVILAYGTDDVTYDRGPSAGPNAWNMTAPDGLIDLSNDILGVIQQYQHSCA